MTSRNVWAASAGHGTRLRAAPGSPLPHRCGPRRGPKALRAGQGGEPRRHAGYFPLNLHPHGTCSPRPARPFFRTAELCPRGTWRSSSPQGPVAQGEPSTHTGQGPARGPCPSCKSAARAPACAGCGVPPEQMPAAQGANACLCGMGASPRPIPLRYCLEESPPARGRVFIGAARGVRPRRIPTRAGQGLTGRR